MSQASNTHIKIYKLSLLRPVCSLFDLLLFLPRLDRGRRVGRSVHQICQIRLLVAAGFADGLKTVRPFHLLRPVGNPLNFLHPPSLLFLTSQVDIKLGNPRLIDEDGAGEMLYQFTRG